MSKQKAPPLWLLLVLITPLFSYGQTTHAFTAKECADFAAKNNVNVKNALIDIAQQEQQNREITAQALPAVNANASVTDNFKIATQLLPGEFFGQPQGTFIPVKFGTKWIGTGGVELRQVLFDGQVFIGLKARQSSIDLRVRAKELTEEVIRANIYKIYYQLVASRTQIELLDSNINRISKLQRDTKIMFDNGFSERIDVDKLEVQLVNLQTEKLKASNSIQAGYYGLKVLMGMPITDSLQLTEAITDETIKGGLPEENYQYADRKEYKLLEANKRLYEYNVRRYKLAKLPTLNFAANYSENAQRNSFNFTKSGEPWFPAGYYNVSLKVPIFNGFANDARIKSAKLELQRIDNNFDSLKLSIDRDVTVSKLNFTTAVQSMDYQKKNMALAEKVYYQTTKKYQIGTGSNTEINTAQTDLKQAQTNYIQAMYDAIIARIDYLRATGKLQ